MNINGLLFKGVIALIGWVCISRNVGKRDFKTPKQFLGFGRPSLLRLSTCLVLLGRVPFSSLSLVFEKPLRMALPLPLKVTLDPSCRSLKEALNLDSLYSSKLHHSPFFCWSQIPCSQRQRLHASSHYRRHDRPQAWRIFLYPQTVHLSFHQKQIKREFKSTRSVSRQQQQHGCI